MVSSLLRYKWVALPLAVIVLLAVLSPLLLPQLVHDLVSGSGHGVAAGSPIVPPFLDQQAQDVGMVVHWCADTPPLYPSSLAHEAASAIASTIDASFVPGYGGLRFFSSYMASHSAYDDAVSFTVPSVPLAPVPPVQQHDPNNPYHEAQLKQQYQQALAAFHTAVTGYQEALALLRAQVRENTNRLRSLSFPFDAKASDLYGCLSYGAAHVHVASGAKTRLLLIASDLINNTGTDELGSFSLSGVDVKVIFYSCDASTVACQARVTSIKHLVMQAHAKSFTVLDVAESQAQQIFF